MPTKTPTDGLPQSFPLGQGYDGSVYTLYRSEANPKIYSLLRDGQLVNPVPGSSAAKLVEDLARVKGIDLQITGQSTYAWSTTQAGAFGKVAKGVQDAYVQELVADSSKIFHGQKLKLADGFDLIPGSNEPNAPIYRVHDNGKMAWLELLNPDSAVQDPRLVRLENGSFIIPLEANEKIPVSGVKGGAFVTWNKSMGISKITFENGDYNFSSSVSNPNGMTELLEVDKAVNNWRTNTPSIRSALLTGFKKMPGLALDGIKSAKDGAVAVKDTVLEANGYRKDFSARQLIGDIRESNLARTAMEKGGNLKAGAQNLINSEPVQNAANKAKDLNQKYNPLAGSGDASVISEIEQNLTKRLQPGVTVSDDLARAVMNDGTKVKPYLEGNLQKGIYVNMAALTAEDTAALNIDPANKLEVGRLGLSGGTPTTDPNVILFLDPENNVQKLMTGKLPAAADLSTNAGVSLPQSLSPEAPMNNTPQQPVTFQASQGAEKIAAQPWQINEGGNRYQLMLENQADAQALEKAMRQNGFAKGYDPFVKDSNGKFVITLDPQDSGRLDEMLRGTTSSRTPETGFFSGEDLSSNPKNIPDGTRPMSPRDMQVMKELQQNMEGTTRVPPSQTTVPPRDVVGEFRLSRPGENVTSQPRTVDPATQAKFDAGETIAGDNKGSFLRDTDVKKPVAPKPQTIQPKPPVNEGLATLTPEQKARILANEADKALLLDGEKRLASLRDAGVTGGEIANGVRAAQSALPTLSNYANSRVIPQVSPVTSSTIWNPSAIENLATKSESTVPLLADDVAERLSTAKTLGGTVFKVGGAVLGVYTIAKNTYELVPRAYDFTTGKGAYNSFLRENNLQGRVRDAYDSTEKRKMLAEFLQAGGTAVGFLPVPIVAQVTGGTAAVIGGALETRSVQDIVFASKVTLVSNATPEQKHSARNNMVVASYLGWNEKERPAVSAIANITANLGKMNDAIIDVILDNPANMKLLSQDPKVFDPTKLALPAGFDFAKYNETSGQLLKSLGYSEKIDIASTSMFDSRQVPVLYNAQTNSMDIATDAQYIALKRFQDHLKDGGNWNNFPEEFKTQLQALSVPVWNTERKEFEFLSPAVFTEGSELLASRVDAFLAMRLLNAEDVGKLIEIQKSNETSLSGPLEDANSGNKNRLGNNSKNKSNEAWENGTPNGLFCYPGMTYRINGKVYDIRLSPVGYADIDGDGTVSKYQASLIYSGGKLIGKFDTGADTVMYFEGNKPSITYKTAPVDIIEEISRQTMEIANAGKKAFLNDRSETLPSGSIVPQPMSKTVSKRESEVRSN